MSTRWLPSWLGAWDMRRWADTSVPSIGTNPTPATIEAGMEPVNGPAIYSSPRDTLSSVAEFDVPEVAGTIDNMRVTWYQHATNDLGAGSQYGCPLTIGGSATSTVFYKRYSDGIDNMRPFVGYNAASDGGRNAGTRG